MSDFLVYLPAPAAPSASDARRGGYSSDDDRSPRKKRSKKTRPESVAKEVLELLPSEDEDESSSDESPRRPLSREEALDRTLTRLVAQAERGEKRSRRPAVRLDYTLDMQRSKSFSPSSKPPRPRPEDKCPSYDDPGSSAGEESEEDEPEPEPEPKKPVANASWRRPRQSPSALPPKKRPTSPGVDVEHEEVLEVEEEDYADTIRRRAAVREREARA